MRKSLAVAATGTMMAAALLSATGTASASTVVRGPAKARTSLSISAFGRGTITGTLTSRRAPLAREDVTLYSVGPRNRLRAVQTELTGRNGSVVYNVAPRTTTTYELVFAGTRNLAPSFSGTVTLRGNR